MNEIISEIDNRQGDLTRRHNYLQKLIAFKDKKLIKVITGIRHEKVETLPLIVIKKDNNREPYDRQKILAGIVRSCHKRPISLEQINHTVDEIENQIFNLEEKEVTTTDIGAIVMDKLKQLDEVAYVRFASVYREFKDVNTFLDEINKILK